MILLLLLKVKGDGEKNREALRFPAVFLYSMVKELITEPSSMALRVKVLPSSTR